jgi:hypothetical protein
MSALGGRKSPKPPGGRGRGWARERRRKMRKR